MLVSERRPPGWQIVGRAKDKHLFPSSGGFGFWGFEALVLRDRRLEHPQATEAIVELAQNGHVTYDLRGPVNLISAFFAPE